MFFCSHKKSVYMPHREFRLLSQIYVLINEGLYYIEYKRHFEAIESRFSKNDKIWLIHTVNGYHDLAVGRWCKVFGSSDEPTYYTRLFDVESINKMMSGFDIRRDNIASFLFGERCQIKEFNKFREKAIDYRNKYHSHREHDPEAIKEGMLANPVLDIPKKTFLSLFELILNIIKTFSARQDDFNKFEFIYDDISKDDIVGIIKESIPNLQ